MGSNICLQGFIEKFIYTKRNYRLLDMFYIGFMVMVLLSLDIRQDFLSL